MHTSAKLKLFNSSAYPPIPAISNCTVDILTAGGTLHGSELHALGAMDQTGSFEPSREYPAIPTSEQVSGQ